jgi:hypothetical protein
MRVPAVLLLALTAGCSVAVEDEGPIDADGSIQGGSIQGAVIVDQIATANGARTRVSARFVRVSGGIDQAAAEHVIGAPRFDASSPLGCSLVEGEEPMTATGGSIELLDVGELILHYAQPAQPFVGAAADDADEGSVSVPLAARAFPDVGELVSGIVYTSRDGDEVIPFGGRFFIESSGSAQLDGFTLRAEAPRPLSGITLFSTPLNSAGFNSAGFNSAGFNSAGFNSAGFNSAGFNSAGFNSAGLASAAGDELDDFLIAGDDLVLGWSAGQTARGDRIYVDITPDEQVAAGRTLRCVFEDDGEAVVPAALIDHRPGTVLEVEIHRHRRTTPHDVSSSALDAAVVDFDFAVAARVLVAEYGTP